MSFATPPAYAQAPLDPAARPLSGDQTFSLSFEQIAQLIMPVRGGHKIKILGTKVPVLHLEESTSDVPLVFVVRRANYDFAIAIWRDRVLVEVRIKESTEPRGYTWPHTIEELHAVLQTIVDDKTAGQTVKHQAASPSLTRASWVIPQRPARSSDDYPGRIIQHSRGYTGNYAEPVRSRPNHDPYGSDYLYGEDELYY